MITHANAVGVNLFLLVASLSFGLAAAAPKGPPNVLLITADDLNYDSVGAYGCEVPGITPHIDRLAREGMLFRHAHVNIAVCQPSRQSIMTGRYPHRNGAEGFDPIDEDVPTLQERLRAAGYLNGILGKEIHLKPKHKYCWDYYITESDLASGAGIGRSPQRYHEHTKAFIALAKDQKKPFFLMANIHDPHRPFAGSEQEKRSWGHDLPKLTRRIGEEEITVPMFLPDLTDTRREALEESGLAKDTLVMFLSDNGMAVPFAKANCYLNSTKTPWLVKWPGRVKPGSVDSEHLISGIDYMPTILAALGLDAPEGMDGSSFLPLLRGEKQADREHAFTEFHKTFARRCFPMRAVQGRRFGYLVNFWAGRTPPMRMDSTSGLSFKAMQEAGESDPQIASRVTLFEHRVLEEFYDFENDPDGLKNLIDDPRHRDEIKRMRSLLEERMKRTGDPALQAFRDRDNPAALDQFMEQQQARAKGGTKQ